MNNYALLLLIFILTSKNVFLSILCLLLLILLLVRNRAKNIDYKYIMQGVLIGGLNHLIYMDFTVLNFIYFMGIGSIFFLKKNISMNMFLEIYLLVFLIVNGVILCVSL